MKWHLAVAIYITEVRYLPYLSHLAEKVHYFASCDIKKSFEKILSRKDKNHFSDFIDIDCILLIPHNDNNWQRIIKCKLTLQYLTDISK